MKHVIEQASIGFVNLVNPLTGLTAKKKSCCICGLLGESSHSETSGAEPPTTWTVVPEASCSTHQNFRANST